MTASFLCRIRTALSSVPTFPFLASRVITLPPFSLGSRYAFVPLTESSAPFTPGSVTISPFTEVNVIFFSTPILEVIIILLSARAEKLPSLKTLSSTSASSPFCIPTICASPAAKTSTLILLARIRMGSNLPTLATSSVVAIRVIWSLARR